MNLHNYWQTSAMEGVWWQLRSSVSSSSLSLIIVMVESSLSPPAPCNTQCFNPVLTLNKLGSEQTQLNKEKKLQINMERL